MLSTCESLPPSPPLHADCPLVFAGWRRTAIFMSLWIIFETATNPNNGNNQIIANLTVQKPTISFFSPWHYCLNVISLDGHVYLLSLLSGLDGGGGGAFVGLGGPTEVAMGLGPARGGAEVLGPGLEEPMNLTKAGGVPFFLGGGVLVCSTSITAGLAVSDSCELK